MKKYISKPIALILSLGLVFALTGCTKPNKSSEAKNPVTETTMEASTPTATEAEEASQQCSYCGAWFSVLSDDDIGNPFERHMLEEKEKHFEEPAGESEMAVCPDCGGSFEVGNIFRNHICPGKE